MQGTSDSPLSWPTTWPNKDDFYYLLQKRVDDIPRYDVLLLLDDLIARIGCNNKNRERVMEKLGLGDLTDNGERVIDLCEENSLICGGTIFTHRNIHKLTWTSTDGGTQSQIDHIIINSKWKCSLQDVRIMINSDIGSERKLLVANDLEVEKCKGWNGKKPMTGHSKLM